MFGKFCTCIQREKPFYHKLKQSTTMKIYFFLYIYIQSIHYNSSIQTNFSKFTREWIKYKETFVSEYVNLRKVSIHF